MAELNMTSMDDVVRYVPGIGYAQGEGNRDTPVFRGNSSTSDFYVDGVRDDVQYYRDVYNVERVEALKGPNAMIFGRGGVGGVINRVQRVADWMPHARSLSLQLGSYDNRRITTDLNQPLNSKVALRLTGIYENTDTYRSGVGLERYGINPTVAVSLGREYIVAQPAMRYFHDDRTADRGIPSFQGRPLATPMRRRSSGMRLTATPWRPSTRFSTLVEHSFSDGVTLRNRTSFADYDKFYQNIFPGAVNAAGTTVEHLRLQQRHAATESVQPDRPDRRPRTGRVGHTILVGIELGRQDTDNFRNTAFFTTLSPTTTTLTLPVTDPTTSLPAEFRQGATDADNHGIATVAAVYAQDQVSLSEHVQAVAGLRFDNFNVDFHNNRTDADFSSHDGQVSPRLGLIYKPIAPCLSTAATACRSSREPASSCRRSR